MGFILEEEYRSRMVELNGVPAENTQNSTEPGQISSSLEHPQIFSNVQPTFYEPPVLVNNFNFAQDEPPTKTIDLHTQSEQEPQYQAVIPPPPAVEQVYQPVYPPQSSLTTNTGNSSRNDINNSNNKNNSNNTSTSSIGDYVIHGKSVNGVVVYYEDKIRIQGSTSRISVNCPSGNVYLVQTPIIKQPITISQIISEHFPELQKYNSNTKFVLKNIFNSSIFDSHTTPVPFGQYSLKLQFKDSSSAVPFILKNYPSLSKHTYQPLDTQTQFYTLPGYIYYHNFNSTESLYASAAFCMDTVPCAINSNTVVVVSKNAPFLLKYFTKDVLLKDIRAIFCYSEGVLFSSRDSEKKYSNPSDKIPAGMYFIQQLATQSSFSESTRKISLTAFNNDQYSKITNPPIPEKLPREIESSVDELYQEKAKQFSKKLRQFCFLMSYVQEKEKTTGSITERFSKQACLVCGKSLDSYEVIHEHHDGFKMLQDLYDELKSTDEWHQFLKHHIPATQEERSTERPIMSSSEEKESAKFAYFPADFFSLENEKLGSLARRVLERAKRENEAN